MTPNEIRILNIVEESDRVSKRKVAEVLGFSTDYAGYMLERLANEGYLRTIDRGIYALLFKGVDALLSQLYFAESNSEAGIERLSMERARIRKEIQRLSARNKNLVTA